MASQSSTTVDSIPIRNAESTAPINSSFKDSNVVHSDLLRSPTETMWRLEAGPLLLLVCSGGTSSRTVARVDGGDENRRSTLGLGACIATCGLASAFLPPASEASDLAAKIPQGYEFGTVQDTTLAYEFVYPKQTVSGKKLAIFLSKKPTRYSSVTPVSADAEQRIVCQVADFKNNVFVSISVCRPPGILTGRDPSEWRSGEVAQAILNDRSVGRNSLGRRSFMGQLEGTKAETKDGNVYWQYESITQGSPTPTDSSRETFRHAYSVTTFRPGQNGEPYLYTLNTSCPEEIWDDLAPLLGVCISSFRLTTPVKGYVPPDVTPLLPF